MHGSARRQHAWREIPDDGLRVYADPFPILYRGRCWLFVEDYAHALGKGVISAVPFDGNGPVGTPVTVLETPGHLSYPFVFERDGGAWMVPESCDAWTIDLYGALDAARRQPGRSTSPRRGPPGGSWSATGPSEASQAVLPASTVSTVPVTLRALSDTR